DSTLIQTVTEASPISIVSQIPSDFNDFAAAFGLGNFSTAQAASAILGAPVVQAPLQALLLGDKVLTYSANSSLGYSFSRHLSFQASSFATGGENRSGTQPGVPIGNYLTPFGFGANASMNWTYSPTPRTQLGVDVEGSRLLNHYQDSYLETTT